MTPDDDIVEVYRARNLIEAHSIRLMLESEQIPVTIGNEILQGVVGEIAMGWSSSPQLLVRERDALRARTLIAESMARSTSRDEESLACLNCGAAMDSNSVCMACGWTFAASAGDSAESPPDKMQSGASIEGPVTAPVETRSSEVDPTDQIAPPVMSFRDVRLEVAVVLSFGVLPHLANSLFNADSDDSASSYWQTALVHAFYSLSNLSAVLYVIYRSGETWERFGIQPPRLTDAFVGLVLFILIGMTDQFFVSFQSDSSAQGSEVSVPQSSFDYLMMFVMHIANAAAEESVTRAYLITRLQQLLGRTWLAVVIAAGLFASYHSYQGIPEMANILVFGLILGAFFSIYPRIWPLIFCHAFGNICIEFSRLS